MMRLQPGSPLPLGATFDGQGVNFTLVAPAAEQVELCLFDAAGHEQSLVLTARSGDTWHGYLPGIQIGQRYGYRVSGPFDAAAGLRFNRQKLLIDPYARQLSGVIGDDPSLYQRGEQPDAADSAAAVPKARVVDSQDYDWQGDQPPAIPWGKTVIYEAHVRGLTKMHPDIPVELRGSYAALAHPLMIDYFKQLGITTLELLPIQQHGDEPRLQARGLKNYWGYNTVAPYAVEPSYASGRPGISPLTELRDAVKALHQAGIEVILDVVFNHSAELDLTGPVLSWRGIDNASYYWLNQDGSPQNLTGCGNTLRLDSPQGVAWVIDCLRYWVRECHIDGFRFDLATVLGRTPAFSPEAPLLQAILGDSQLAGCKLIAEPWDIGSDGYQLGAFPAGFAEWNDHYRDDMRRFWLQGECSLGQFAQRFAASSTRFNHDERPPSASINQLTSHDGFTLRDLLCFNHKHNQFNGDNNQDGQNNNQSNNHGWEGLDGDDALQQRRRASQRALLASLLLSQGTPMLLAGDEQGNSQLGNNNAYCQDNFISWLDWAAADQSLVSFTAELIKLRQQIPALQQDNWWQEGDGNVQWLGADGQPLQGEQWQQGEQQVLQICLSQQWLLLINRGEQGRSVQLPAGHWQPAAPFAEVNRDQGYLPARSFSVWVKTE